MKKINTFNLMSLALLIVADVFYIFYEDLIIKSIASLIFVIIGFVNLTYMLKEQGKKISAYLLFIGLCFACLGDILLEIQFLVGAILFAIGHIFYFVSYCKLIKFNWKDLFFILSIFIPSLLVILCVPIFDFGGWVLQLLCCVYAFVISLMMGKSIANFAKSRSILNIIIMIGSVLFFFSDLMLLFHVFADLSRVFSVLCLATYYPAEFLLAYSILKQ